nr:O-antigen ligase family protein [Thermoleophilaceae bacterium]
LAAVAAYASVSRGALLAAGVGLGVLLLIAPRRGALLVSAAIVGVGAAGAVYALQRFPGLLDDPTAGYGRTVEGRAFAPTLIVATVAAGLVQATVAAIKLRSVAVANLGRVGRPLALGLGVVVLVGMVALYAVKGDRIEGESASRLGSFESFVDRQVDEFLLPSIVARQGSDRLTDASGSRSDLYRVALGGFAEHPLIGGGGGSFEPLYYERRSLDAGTRDAHSLYLETLSELGLIGFGALALFLGAFGFAAARALQSGRPDRGTAAASVAAVVVLLAHSAVDWDWQVSALTGFGLLLAALVFPVPRARSRGADEPLALSGAE